MQLFFLRCLAKNVLKSSTFYIQDMKSGFNSASTERNSHKIIIDKSFTFLMDHKALPKTHYYDIVSKLTDDKCLIVTSLRTTTKALKHVLGLA